MPQAICKFPSVFAALKMVAHPYKVIRTMDVLQREEMIAEVCDMLTGDQRLTISGIAKELEFHFGSCQAIVISDVAI